MVDSENQISTASRELCPCPVKCVGGPRGAVVSVTLSNNIKICLWDRKDFEGTKRQWRQ